MTSIGLEYKITLYQYILPYTTVRGTAQVKHLLHTYYHHCIQWVGSMLLVTALSKSTDQLASLYNFSACLSRRLMTLPALSLISGKRAISWPTKSSYIPLCSKKEEAIWTINYISSAYQVPYCTSPTHEQCYTMRSDTTLHCLQ